MATSITWVKERLSSANEMSLDESCFRLPTVATSKTRARNQKRRDFRHRWLASPHGGDFLIEFVLELLAHLSFFGEDEGEYPLMVGFTCCHTYTHWMNSSLRGLRRMFHLALKSRWSLMPSAR